nr:dehydrogenase red2 [Quercus suber]
MHDGSSAVNSTLGDLRGSTAQLLTHLQAEIHHSRQYVLFKRDGRFYVRLYSLDTLDGKVHIFADRKTSWPIMHSITISLFKAIGSGYISIEADMHPLMRTFYSSIMQNVEQCSSYGSRWIVGYHNARMTASPEHGGHPDVLVNFLQRPVSSVDEPSAAACNDSTTDSALGYGCITVGKFIGLAFGDVRANLWQIIADDDGQASPHPLQPQIQLQVSTIVFYFIPLTSIPQPRRSLLSIIMPFHNGWLPREGLTGDPVGRLIKRTALNPAITLPILLAALFTKRGSDLAAQHPTALSRFRTLVYLGLIRWASSYLDARNLSNGVQDKYVWDKEIAIVTGGAGVIGGNIVKLLAEQGVKVAVLDVIPMTYEAGPNVYYYKCDITSPSAIATVASQIRSALGHPTILINNAGVARGKTILNATEKDVRFTFEVNTLAHYWLAKEFVPAMVSNNHGTVVTVASLAAYVCVPDMVDYASSKAAALAFHEGLTAELKTRYKAPKVRTIVVNPGYTRTSLFEGYNNSANSFLMPTMTPETVAETIVKKVLSGTGGSLYLPGFGVMMTWLRALPHWMQNHVRSKGENIMTNWRGRQVIDVDKWTPGGQTKPESGETDSTVLVPPVASKVAA